MKLEKGCSSTVFRGFKFTIQGRSTENQSAIDYWSCKMKLLTSPRVCTTDEVRRAHRNDVLMIITRSSEAVVCGLGALVDKFCIIDVVTPTDVRSDARGRPRFLGCVKSSAPEKIYTSWVSELAFLSWIAG